jgi:hypothetical protein
LTKLPGSKMRDDIARLLRIRYDAVQTEVRLMATSADVVFSDDSNALVPRRIAVEAKDWSKPLTSKNLAEIYNLYRPSIENREVDSLLIVGRHSLASSPRDTVSQMRGVFYVTYDEFESTLINFHPVINDNILAFRNHESYSNFIESKVLGRDQTVFEATLSWLDSKSSGLVIFGGYGVGKTSFSLYLAASLSSLNLSGEFKRKPLRISLGGLFSKQDLPGLICATLTGADGGPGVKDFSYNAFLEMNRLGKLLLIFDGFDEMRHAMDIDDFVYTFEQIKPLFCENAKIIILGRPDSFFSNSEEDRVISSMFDNASEAVKRIEKIELALFSHEQVSTYLDNYSKSNSVNWNKKEKEHFKKAIKRYTTVDNDVLLRPVHLSMFTKILSDFVNSGSSLTKYELYSQFIYRFSRREETKAARVIRAGDRSSGLDPRSRFMQNVAWWLLAEKKENRFSAEELPRRLVPQEFSNGVSETASMREALTGSVIEQVHAGVLGTKGNRVYYFPHKSYIEYLVSSYLCRDRIDSETYKQFFGFFNGEIIDFISEGPAFAWTGLRNGIHNYTGPFAYKVFEICSREVDIDGIFQADSFNQSDERDLYIFYTKLREEGDRSQVAEFCRRLYTEAQGRTRIGVALNCMADALSNSSDQALALSFFVSTLVSVGRFDMEKAELERTIFLFDLSQLNIRVYLALKLFDYSGKDVTVSTLDLMSIADKISRKERSLIFPADRKKRSSLTISKDTIIAEANRLSISSGDQTGARVQHFLKLMSSDRRPLTPKLGGSMERLFRI